VHWSILRWAERTVTELDLAGRSVLEVGSYDVNGSVRAFFHGPYVGVDARVGPGVDVACWAQALPFTDDRFDVVVSTEMLEHDPLFWVSLPEMKRVLRPGGHLMLSARGFGFGKHDIPHDYWRFTVEGMRSLFDWTGLTEIDIHNDIDDSPGVLALAMKP